MSRCQASKNTKTGSRLVTIGHLVRFEDAGRRRTKPRQRHMNRIPDGRRNNVVAEDNHSLRDRLGADACGDIRLDRMRMCFNFSGLNVVRWRWCAYFLFSVNDFGNLLCAKVFLFKYNVKGRGRSQRLSQFRSESRRRDAIS
jgi:hypothetical protein